MEQEENDAVMATAALVPGFAPAAVALADVRALVETYMQPDVMTVTHPDGTDAVVTVGHDGVARIGEEVFAEFRDHPRFRHGHATFTDVQSLIDHANRFKDADSTLFASDDPARPSVTAVLDYHPAGAAAVTPARFGRHRGGFAFPLADEWKTWTGASGLKLSVTGLALFLEDNGVDVLPVPPITGEGSLTDDAARFVQSLGGVVKMASPERLFELAAGLTIHERSAVIDVHKISSGEGQVMFQSEHVDEKGKPVNIPSLFSIGIPVFRNGPAYRVIARLRYRKGPGGVEFHYDLWRADRVFNHAFDEVCAKVAAETGLPLFKGSPE